MIFKRKLRYVLVEASRSVNLGDEREERDLRSRLHGVMGEAAYFRANPRTAAQLSESVFIISVNRGCEKDLGLALSFVKTLGSESVGFWTIKTSGTVKGLKAQFKKLYG
ncbi:Uncharacterised protein [uncultured archaeon]|nr:Uncharacterised protein [uncultured archaeon]